VDRTIAGRKGQAFLRDLLQALDEMPEKRLIVDALESSGEVCAIGALGRSRGVKMDDLDPHEPEAVAKSFGISTMLAQEVVYENDERHYRQTPEERWIRMREWVQSHIKPITDERAS
jgi:hypothetical protein